MLLFPNEQTGRDLTLLHLSLEQNQHSDVFYYIPPPQLLTKFEVEGKFSSMLTV